MPKIYGYEKFFNKNNERLSKNKSDNDMRKATKSMSHTTNSNPNNSNKVMKRDKGH